MKDDLSPVMRNRLEKWRKDSSDLQSAKKIGLHSLSKCRMVRGDYGDDIRDFEKHAQDHLTSKDRSN